MTKDVDLKQTTKGEWVICDPFTGHVYCLLSEHTSEDEVLNMAAQIESGWLPKDRGF